MNINRLYVERAVRDHLRTREIMGRFPDADVIECRRYGEVFNKAAQNFRLQKQQPGLILAEKYPRRLLPAPAQYGLGGRNNYYFSHMLNCLYDCRYCFLQGMYRSANYVLFVNYEDFFTDIIALAREDGSRQIHLFSGYDCDSLAFEPVTGFARYFVGRMEEVPNVLLELRSKSTQIRALLELPPRPNVVVAFSLSPEKVVDALEHQTPRLERRLAALRRLQEAGWQVGIRFDPMICFDGAGQAYRRLVERVFQELDGSRIHSVCLGAFRMPEDFFNRIARMYPRERFLAAPFERDGGMVSYPRPWVDELIASCHEALREHIPPARVFVMGDGSE